MTDHKALFKAADSVLLTVQGREFVVKVSDVQGVRTFAFAVDGVPLPAARRRFVIQPDETKVLQWTMIGPGGSSMVVQVLDGNTVIAARTPSKIPEDFTSSFDLLVVRG